MKRFSLSKKKQPEPATSRIQSRDRSAPEVDPAGKEVEAVEEKELANGCGGGGTLLWRVGRGHIVGVEKSGAGPICV